MFLTFNPQLALTLKNQGAKFPERSAIVLGQLLYWLDNPKYGIELDGQRWIYNSIADWANQFSGLWSAYQIRATFEELEEMGLVASRHFEGPKATNRRKLYSTCAQRLKALPLSIFSLTKNAISARLKMDFESDQKSIQDNNQLNNSTFPVCAAREGGGQSQEDPECGEGSAEENGRANTSLAQFSSLGDGQYSAASSPVSDELTKREDVASRLQALDIAPEVAIASVPEKVAQLGAEVAARVLVESLDAIAQNPRSECPPAMLKVALREGGWKPRQAPQAQPKVESSARAAYPWESEPGKPLEAFLRWCANQFDKVSVERRRSAAYSWIVKDPNKTQALFEDFLVWCDRVADSQLAVQSGGGTPSLPSFFAAQEVPTPDAVMAKLSQLGAVPARQMSLHPATVGAPVASYLSEAVRSQAEKGNEIESISLSDRVAEILSKGKLAAIMASAFLRSLGKEARQEAIALFEADERGAEIAAAWGVQS